MFWYLLFCCSNFQVLFSKMLLKYMKLCLTIYRATTTTVTIAGTHLPSKILLQQKLVGQASKN